MSAKFVSGAVLAAVLGVFPAFSQGLDGPAERPPASYQGQQYVDSRGCVFLRAGYGGTTNWVPRVSRDRRQLCGYPPSGGRVEVAEAAPPAAAPAPAPVVAAAPAAPVVRPAPAAKPGPAASPAPAAKPVVVAAAPKVARPATPTERAATREVRGEAIAAGTTSGGLKLACPAETPVAERFEIRGGGSKVMCTRGDGSLEGANFPRLVEGTTAGHAVGFDAHLAAVAGGKVVVTGKLGADVSVSAKSAKLPEGPPPGYKYAWRDDRLNPNRGKQTYEGFLQQDEIWTRTVPAELREDSKVVRRDVTVVVRRADGSTVRRKGYVSTDASGNRTVTLYGGDGADVPAGSLGPAPVVVSTKSDPKIKAAPSPEPKAAAGRLLVQVGTYGQKSNADGAAGKLKGMGLPVARGKTGKGLQVIYAGPFASASDAKAALSAARRAGFADAVIVQ